MKRKPTLMDVASMAGVSTATVSNVLNNTKNVGEEVRRKINDAVRTLNYIPNNVAKSLRVKESKLIGLMISDIANPFFAQVVRGIEDALAANGYTVILCDTDVDVEKEKTYLRVLLSRRIDGLVVSLAGDEHEYDHFRALDLPVVFFNRTPDSDAFNRVKTQNFEGAYLAASHLIDHGYRRIAIVAGPQHISVGRERLLGFRRALEDRGRVFDPELVGIGQFNVEGGYSAMEELMGRTQKPDAVFTCNNVLTLGAFRFLQGAGYRIPQDIAFLGYDDPDWTTIVEPPLSVIRQHGFEMGLETGALVLECVKNKDIKRVREISLRSELVIRKSCGCLGAESVAG